MSSINGEMLLAAVLLMAGGCADAPEPPSESQSNADLVMMKATSIQWTPPAVGGRPVYGDLNSL